jgi:hypothetical protein
LLRVLVAQLALAAGRLARDDATTSAATLREAWGAITFLAGAPDRPVGGLIDAAWPDAVPDELLKQATDFARVLAAANPSTHRLLTGTHEQILRCEGAFDPDTGHFALRPSRRRRRASGSFYTPPGAAAQVVADTLRAAGGPRFPTVVDPAMGTGVFLLQAVRALAPAGDRAGVAEKCIFGYDLDPIAVDLAVLGIWLETGARLSVLTRHLEVGNPLRWTDPPQRFDVVIGNPPWGIETCAPDGDGSAARPADSFKRFLQLAARLTPDAMGMLVPQAVLLQETHADVRGALLRGFDPYAVITLDDGTFPGTAAPACALIFGPKPGPASIACADFAGRSGASIPSDRWTARGFPLAPDALIALLDRSRRRHPALAQLRHLYRVRDVGINYNRASVARRVLYDAPHPEDPHDLPRYRGRSFGRYSAITRDGWLRHDAVMRLLPGERFSLARSTCALSEKIVLRQTADRIVATLDGTRMAMGRSVIAITAESEVSLPALLACLNSRLLTVLYRVLAGEEGRVLPQVKVSRLLALPVPSPEDHSADWRELHRLATSMLACEGRDSSLDAAIERLVCRVYGLTSEEVALIAPA